MTRRSVQSGAGEVIAGDARRHPHLATAVCPLFPIMLAMVLWASPAHAHTGLVGSNPAADEVVPLTLDHLTLEFDDELRVGSEVVVRGPDETIVTRGQVGVLGTALDVGLDLTVPGRHTVAYRVVGPDGHPRVGSFAFRASADGAAAAGTTAPAWFPGGTTDSSAPPRWLVPLFTLGTLVLLAYTIAAARQRRRRAA